MTPKCKCGAKITYTGLIHIECSGPPSCDNHRKPSDERTAGILTWQEAYTLAQHDQSLHWQTKRRESDDERSWTTGRPEAWFNYPDLRDRNDWRVAK